MPINASWAIGSLLILWKSSLDLQEVQLAVFSVHFDGRITTNHQLPVRILAKTYEHMQRAIDRAYIIDKYGDVWKHARLRGEDYKEVNFLAAYHRDGGVILDAVKDGADRVIDIVANSIHSLYGQAADRGLGQYESMAEQLVLRRQYVQGVGEATQTFSSVAENPPLNWASAYSRRSVTKEIDQLASQIIPDRYDGSTVEISLNGTHAHPVFVFNQEVARRFHLLASRRELGPAMIVWARIRTLDRGNDTTEPGAKIENLDTKREVVLKLNSVSDCDELRPYHNDKPVRIFVAPIIEAMGFDINGGDLVYLGVV